uniref:Putative lysine-specific demethylase 4B n=2 Tax=Schistocephalus solidus TaxID=70667 RepID=A0A0V0J8J0_SCHSO
MTCTGIRYGPHICLEETLSLGSLPPVPTYRPTEAEFADFSACLSSIEEMGAHHMGLCKIIPPKTWCPRRRGYEDLSNFVIERPIIQLTSGTAGVYFQVRGLGIHLIERSQDVRSQKNLTFEKFAKLSKSAKAQRPRFRNISELESQYWSSIKNLQPLYGANVSGTLTDPTEPAFNIPNLESALSLVLAEENVQINGVNTPYLYFGMWATTFAWHVEDIDLYSINYLHFGSPKLWYVIPPAFARRFEAFAREHFKPEFLGCRSFLRHKSVLIHPDVLAEAGIPTRKILQYEGEIMCTFPYGYHAGFNTGLNCAESTNFALPRWVEYGKKATICKCWDDTVRLNMTPFVRKYQPELFEAWCRGQDTAPHPLELYCHFRWGDTQWDRGDYQKQQQPLDFGILEPVEDDLSESSSDDVCICDPIKKACCPVKPYRDEADLNVRGLYYSLAALRMAVLPRYLHRKPIFQALWCGAEERLDAEVYFNELMGAAEPFCSICSFFWPPTVVRKALQGADYGQPLPDFSEPYLSEVAFIRVPADFPRINLEENPASRVLRCASCHVVVHARCYGLPDLETCYNRADLESWICDACSSHASRGRPRCCLCPIRGGALKRLENSSQDGQSFWVHLACAIAVGKGCRFVDVVRRRPLLLRRSELQSNPPSHLPSSASNFHSWDSCRSTPAFLRTGSPPSGGRPALQTSVRQLYRDAYVWEPLKRPKRSARPEPQIITSPRVRKRGRHPKSTTVASRLRGTLRSSVGTTASTSRERCELCCLPAPGGPANLPLVACWHENCPGRVHLTCAQLSGYLVATGRYPHCLYVACRRHPAEYREHEQNDNEVPLEPGDSVYALDSATGHYYPARAEELLVPSVCKVAFFDGTFSRDTPIDCILDHDWSKNGPPKVGTLVKVKWEDGCEYSAIFQGCTLEKWKVRFLNGDAKRLRRDKIFRVNQQIPTHIRKLIISL